MENPGCVRYGNFINYYQFNPPENRLKLLPNDPEIWGKTTEFCALDLGCNSGNLTLGLYNFLENYTKNCKIFGVDLDKTLIERAEELSVNSRNDNIHFECANFMDDSGKLSIKQYMEKQKLQRFDAVFCFSVTMWVHLNAGDEGLKRFLKDIARLGEIIVIEPQPWKCYRSAVRRLKLGKKEFPEYERIEMRETERQIDAFLVENCNFIKVFESEPTQWGRRLFIYKSK